MKSFALISLTVFVIPPRSICQDLQINGPISGLIYDNSSRSIRPVFGFAGGAHLGPSLYGGLDYASIAPNGRSALAASSGQIVFIRDLANPQGSAQVIAGAIADVNHILWAADSSAAVLVAERSARTQRVANLQNALVTEDPIELASSLSGPVVAVAADSSARRVAAGIRGRTGGALLLISEDRRVSRLAALKEPSAVAFTPDGQDLYAADRGTQQILVFRNVAPGTSGAPVVEGIADAIGLASTANQLLVASRTPSTIRGYDLTTFALLAEYRLDSIPDSIDPVAGSPFYRLTTLRGPGDTLWLLNTQSQPSVFFVPSGE